MFSVSSLGHRVHLQLVTLRHCHDRKTIIFPSRGARKDIESCDEAIQRLNGYGLVKLEKNDRSPIYLSYPYVVLMLSEKSSINGLLNNKNF